MEWLSTQIATPQLSSAEGSAEMISDGCADANRKVLIKRA